MKIGLNLGCGNIPFASTDEIRWINFDLYYVPGKPDCSWSSKDYEYHHAGMEDVDEYIAPSTVDLIYVVHSLEHVSYDLAIQIIRKCYKTLKSGGVIEIEVPDLDKAAHLWLETEGLNDRILGLFYGTSGVDGVGQFHLTGFNFNRIRQYLQNAGFSSIEEIEVGAGHGRPEPEYDFRVRAVK